MILYFSATGNSKYVAERIAQATGDEAKSIVGLVEKGETSFADDVIGFVSPTYYYTLPTVSRDFLQSASLDTSYLFFVATYGTSPGGSARHAGQYLGKSIDACFSVRMPDTWTPTFDLSTPEAVAKFTTTTEENIDEAISHVGKRDRGDFMQKEMPAPAAALGRMLYGQARRTKNLHVTDACIGCSLCAKKCPVHAIEMQDGRPVWVKDRCAMCLGCLHRCPKFAIQYGNGKTAEHGQYTNPHVRV